MSAALHRRRPAAARPTALGPGLIPCATGRGAPPSRKTLTWVLSLLPVLAAPAVALPCGSTVDQCLAVCPTAAEVASVNARLNLIFEADPSAVNGLVCFAAQGSADLTRAKERVYQALLMFDRLQFDTPLPWTTQTLGGWLYDETQIEGIRFRSDITFSFCCDPPNYLNLRADFAAQQTTRWINPQSGTGLDGLILLIAHEARHNQGYLHTCGADDQTRAERGAWGVQYYLREWLAYHSDQCFFEAPDPWPTYYLEASAGDSWFLHNSRFCSDMPTGGIGDLPPVPVCVPPIFVDSFESGNTSPWSAFFPPA